MRPVLFLLLALQVLAQTGTEVCEPGYAGAPNCTECAPGTYSFGGQQLRCEPCLAGSFTSKNATSKCTECPEGTYQPKNGSTGCLECPTAVGVGNFECVQSNDCSPGSIRTDNGCIPCPAGYYSLEVNSTKCIECPFGTYAMRNGSKTCDACPVGKNTTSVATTDAKDCHCPAGTYVSTDSALNTMCPPCPVGTYSGERDSINCTACDGTHYNPKIGQTYCQRCLAGEIASFDRTRCVCPAGSYKNNTADGGEVCQPCPEGTFNSNEDVYQCKPCDANTISSAGALRCVPCPTGQTSTDGKKCVCRAGHYLINSTGSTSDEVCVACPAGKYSSASESRNCTTCPKDTYSKEGAVACTPCENNGTAPEGSATCTPATGQPCPPGTFGFLGKENCSACPAGTYSDKEGSLNCTLCPMGSYSFSSWSYCKVCPAGTVAPNRGSANCTDCPAGTTSTETGTKCEPCPVGTIANSTRSSICTPCPQGTTSSPDRIKCICAAGSVPTTDGTLGCKPCDRGYYWTQNLVCAPCPNNTVAPNAYSTNCTKCPDGTMPNLARTECVPVNPPTCPNGTYLTAVGCVGCPLNTYLVASNDGFVCTPCRPGTYTPKPNSTQCVECPAGYFAISDPTATTQMTVNANGELIYDGCRPCSKGFFQAHPASVRCEPCLTGQFTDVEGSITCKPCPTGTSSSTGAASCEITDTPCRPGYWSATGFLPCTQCPSGTYSWNATTCKPCEPGTSTSGQIGAVECYFCAIGTAADVAGSDSCTPCPPGSFSPITGSRVCKKCPRGTYQNWAGQRECIPCPIGSFAHEEGQTVCDGCPSGTASNADGTVCENITITCPPGSYIAGYVSSTTSPVCRPCPAGTYSKEVNSQTCTKCPAGYFSKENSTHCTICPDEETSDSGAAFCVNITTPCTIGRWSATGNHPCFDCEIGKFAPKNGSQYCYNCTEGTVSKPASSQCVPCPYGTYTDPVRSVCIPCEVGTFGPYLQASSCKRCPPGRYMNMTGQKECLLCPPGTYSPQEGAVQCTYCQHGSTTTGWGSTSCGTMTCPPGTYTQLSATGAITACLPCPAGTYNSEANKDRCTPCPAGTYSPPLTTATNTNVTLGAMRCIPCDPGMTSEAGAQRCVPIPTGTVCPPGTFSQDGKTPCTPCPIGTFNEKNGSTTCYPCPRGYYTNELGSIRCAPCIAGTYNPQTNAAQCYPCDIGTYMDLAANDTCIKCPPGTYAPLRGSRACLPCDAGTYQPDWGRAVCLNCPRGTYQPEQGAVRCIPCPGGQNSTEASKGCYPVITTGCPPGTFVVNGSSPVTCTKCPAGTYSNTLNADSCIPCEIGTYSLGGAGQCIKCPADQTTTAPGSSVCVPIRPVCPAGYIPTPSTSTLNSLCTPCGYGYYAAYENALQCIPCPPNTYADSLASTRCIPCREGTYSVSGSSKCFPCPAGTYWNQKTRMCEKCPRGYYQNENGTVVCKPCPVGTYAAQDGSIWCDKCPTGTAVSFTGASNCTRCPANQTNNDQTDCTTPPPTCPPGTYVLNGKCAPCWPGTYSSTENAARCTPCRAGTYSAVNGSRECYPCPRGTYSPKEGATRCFPCAENTIQPATGQLTCIRCGPNQVASSTLIECIDIVPRVCPPGQYEPYPGKGCFDCAPGTYSMYSNSSACTPCPPGTFAENGAAVACKPCPTGTYAPKAGMTRCIPCTDLWTDTRTCGTPNTTNECKPGYYVVAITTTNAVRCAACPPGTFSNKVNANAEDCLRCRPGYYAKGEGNTMCTICPDNTFSGAGAEGCTRCKEGFVAPAGSSSCVNGTRDPTCDNGGIICRDNTYCVKPMTTMDSTLVATTCAPCINCPTLGSVAVDSLTRTGVDASSVDTTTTKRPDETNSAGEEVRGGTVTTIEPVDRNTRVNIPPVTLAPADGNGTRPATKPVIRLDAELKSDIAGIRQNASDGAVIIGSGADIRTSTIDLSGGSGRKLDVTFEDTDVTPVFASDELRFGPDSEIAIRGDGIVKIGNFSGDDGRISFNGRPSLTGTVPSIVLESPDNDNDETRIFLPNGGSLQIKGDVLVDVEGRSTVIVNGDLMITNDRPGKKSKIDAPVVVSDAGEVRAEAPANFTQRVDNSGKIQVGTSARPHFDFIATCTGVIVVKVDWTAATLRAAKRNGVILTYNGDRTKPDNFTCKLQIKTSDDQTIELTVNKGPKRRLLAESCSDVGVYNGTALTFETCTQSSQNNNNAAASLVSPFLPTVFVLFSSLVSLFLSL